MKTATHPSYAAIQVTCASCGTKFETGSTLGHDLETEVCSNCHPAYTGKQRAVETGSRILAFRAKYRTASATTAKSALCALS